MEKYCYYYVKGMYDNEKEQAILISLDELDEEEVQELLFDLDDLEIQKITEKEAERLEDKGIEVTFNW